MTPPRNHLRALVLLSLVLSSCSNLDRRTEDCTGPATPIHALQGAGAASPRVDETVTVRGVVVGDFQGGDQLGGFFLQEAEPDGDPLTSEGVFVASTRDVAAGNLVRVSGRVAEREGLTELTEVESIEVCRAARVSEPTALSLREVSDLEPFEGMLVRLDDELTIAGSYQLGRHGQLLLSVGRPFQKTNDSGSEPAGARLLLDDGSGTENPLQTPYLDAAGTRRLGDTVAGITGVVTQRGRGHVLHPTVPPAFASGNPRAASPPAVGGTVRVASFNLLNFFTTLGERGASNAGELERQRKKLVATIEALDAAVVGVIELENNGDTAIRALVEALDAAAGEGTWAHVPLPEGGLGDDPIRVGLIYRPALVSPVGTGSADMDPVYRRPPFAQTFEAAGERFTVVVNHFKSKGCRGAEGTEADAGDGQGCWNPQRTRQARRLLDFVASLQEASGDPDVLVIGDLNAYGAEDPIRALTGGGLNDLMAAHVEPADRYSYVYRGAAGYLDHALATPSLAGRVSGAAFWHINADEPRVLDYNTEHNPPALYRSDPYRSSDHDPVLVGLAF